MTVFHCAFCGFTVGLQSHSGANELKGVFFSPTPYLLGFKYNSDVSETVCLTACVSADRDTVRSQHLLIASGEKCCSAHDISDLKNATSIWEEQYVFNIDR